MDNSTCQIGLLHDIVEDSNITYQFLNERYGEKIAVEVMQVTQLENETLEQYLKKAISTTWGLLIKLVDRLDNLETTRLSMGISLDSVIKTINKTESVYIPLFEKYRNKLLTNLNHSSIINIELINKLINQIKYQIKEIKGEIEMKNFIRREFEGRDRERAGVFVIPYFSGKIYRNYDQVEQSIREKNILAVMPLTRAWQGNMGWIGGMVDEGETILQALVREVKEETNVNIDASKLKPLCRHIKEEGGIDIITYYYETTQEEALEWIRNTTHAEHFGAETGGLNMIQIHEKSIDIVEKGFWAATAGIELKIFLDEIIHYEFK